MLTIFKSRILFIFVWLASVLLVFYYRDTFISFTIFYSLLLLAACAAVSVLLAPLLIRVEQAAGEPHARKREEYRCGLRIRNSGLLPYANLQLHFCCGDLLDYRGGDLPSALPARREYDADIPVTFPYRGVYQVGVFKATVTDYWGLLRYTFPLRRFSSVVVYPDWDPAFSLPLKAQYHDQARDRAGHPPDDAAEISDLRPYRASDDYRNIHWKLSAKRNEWIVKNHQSPLHISVLLFLDCRPLLPPGPAQTRLEDRMITQAASAIRFCTLRQIPVHLFCGPAQADRLQVDSPEALGGAFQALARLPFRQERSELPAFAQLVAGESGQRDLVLLLGRIDAFACSFALEAAMAGHNLQIHLFLREDAGEEEASRLEQLKARGISVVTVEVDAADE